MKDRPLGRRDFLKVGAGSIAAAATVSGLPCLAANKTTEAKGAGGFLSGSFVTCFHPNVWDMQYSDECLYWKEENWQALIRQMHAVGMDTIIWANSAFWGRPLFPGYETTVGRPLKMGCHDPLKVVAEEAERLNMKVFYAIGVRGRCSQVRDYWRMQKPWPNYWFQWNTALTKALVERYGDRPSFAGLYLAYEITFEPLHLELYERLVAKDLRAAVGKVPIMASPGSLGVSKTPLEDLPAALKKTTINILAPQDYGGRSNDVKKALKLVRANADGLKKIAPKLRDDGITLWSNCETFSFERLPDGRNACIPGPIERIVEQIEMQSPLVDKLITWTYPGLINQRTDLVNIGPPTVDKLHDDYVAYLKSKGLLGRPDRDRA